MPKIKVDGEEKYPRPYWPQELKDDGFVGEMEIIKDAVTATVVHPKAKLAQVKRSLEIALQDIELRIEQQQAEKGKGQDGEATGAEGL